MSFGKRHSAVPSGKYRRKRIRSLTQLSEDILKEKCHDRQVRHLRLVKLGAPEVILEYDAALWFDTEYALSLVQGLYDEMSAVNLKAMRLMRDDGYEDVPGDMWHYRRDLMDLFTPVLVAHHMPREYGFLCRLVQSDEKLQEMLRKA